ncbi:MAG: preprotein translocase subunit SecA, partial [Firmicutes bacterium]|nr:preprotein translocase subunit SecA [Bacillota bacterium]
MGIGSYLSGLDNKRQVNKISKMVDYIDSLEPKYQAMTDEELKNQTQELKNRLKNNQTLDDILPYAFALVREAGKRVLSMRHFRVQLMGGIVLHQGRIAEMGTGEGKTLVSTLPAYLNALEEKGVHIVTVNDYLAKRDAEWMGKIHRFLGLSVGVVVAQMGHDQKQAAYNCDITYATNNELGFDYLRDNMTTYKEDKVQRPLNYAIIDEVDSILIDEARTPLIISGRGSKSSDMYKTANSIVRQLKASTNVDDEGKLLDGEDGYNGDFEVDRKKKAISLTDKGIQKVEYLLGIDNLSDFENNEKSHFINNALKAVYVFKREDDYIVQDGEVIIVDEFTGRLMIGRRYSDGLHQAIEAKENVRIQNENRTLATITFQNYFRLYTKLGGMTGTAKTEEAEFRGIYNLDVVTIPPNRPSQRVDENDIIYSTIPAKNKAIVEEVKECFDRRQPVLVGTTTVEKSEELSALFKKAGIPHNVLNAKNHEREAEIVAQAGKKGTITIATNMAGRGTDILLGGNPEYLAKKRMRDEGESEETIANSTSFFNTEDPDILAARAKFKKYYDEYKTTTDKEKEEVIECGGLRIVGTERHESRRIDNQLRGRAGRQGDLGSSLFFLSMDDDVLRLFGGPRMKRVATTLRIDEDVPYEMPILSRLVKNAQSSLEGRNYSIRKQVLEYDDVMNVQRKIIYQERDKVLNGESVHEQVEKMMESACEKIVSENTDPKVDYTEWDCDGL